MADVAYLKIISFLHLFIGRGTCTWSPEDNLQKSVFSSYHRGLGEGRQIWWQAPLPTEPSCLVYR